MITSIKRNGIPYDVAPDLFKGAIAVHVSEDEILIEHIEPIEIPTEAEVSSIMRDVQLGKVRAQREPLLIEADWRINRAEDNGEDLSALRAYRQALRSVTLQADPWAVEWPAKPWGD